MGLDIGHKDSKHSYRCGYHGLHLIRYLAYRSIGGEKSYADYMGQSYGEDGGRYDWLTMVAHQQFPNLMFHSDCDGEYTRGGKCDPLNGALLTGDSVALLDELKRLSRFADLCDVAHLDGVRTDTYWMLLRLVSDVVSNHDGKLRLR